MSIANQLLLLFAGWALLVYALCWMAGAVPSPRSLEHSCAVRTLTVTCGDVR